MAQRVDADYLVVGAGAAGMAFTDALIDHADVRVALVDRRPAAGGHWLDDYPFVRLHQSSSFYGVASRVLLDGAVQADGPEAGLHERATGAQVCAYYAEVLQDHMVGTGRVEFYPNCDYLGGRQFVSRVSGQRFEVAERCRIVDARYLAPAIPAHSPPPFAVHDGARVVPVNDLVRLDAAPSRYVIVGSGKTATDACVWLMAQRRRPRRDRLGASSRAVDAQPGRGATRPGDLPRHGCRDPSPPRPRQSRWTSVPAPGGGRDHAAHRPVAARRPWPARRPSAPGNSSGCARSTASSVTGTCAPSSPAGWSSTTQRLPSRSTPSSCTAPRKGYVNRP